MSELPRDPTLEQDLKRSHDAIDQQHQEDEDDDAYESNDDQSIPEPERKKMKPSNFNEFVEDTKYWYELIDDLDSGPANYKSFDQLEKGLMDREKIIENIDQLWHVHRARIILESLDLGNAHWNEEFFDLMCDSEEELERNVVHYQDSEFVLKDKVTAQELGLTSEISIEILKEYITKREDIESHGLFLMEKLFQRCQIHTVEEISEMMEKCIQISERNEQAYYYSLSDMYYLHSADANEGLEKWRRYILPRVVKTQNELNLIDDPVILETNEKSIALKKILLNANDEKDKDAFLLEPCDFEDKHGTISEIKFEEMEEQFEEQYPEEVFYCTYLFDLELPDEKGKVGYNLLGLLHSDIDNLNENVFLSILEMVMKMYVRETNALEHQHTEVSELRLAISLMILDCLNKELTYLILSQSQEQAYMLYRPLVRSVLDQFIVDYIHPTKYEKYFFSCCTDPEMTQPMVNILFENKSSMPVDTDNLVWDVTQNQRGINDLYDNSQDCQETKFKKHPIWGDSIDNLKDKYMAQQTESHCKISGKKLDESMYMTIYTDNGNKVQEPISTQNLVSFFLMVSFNISLQCQLFIKENQHCEELHLLDCSVENLIENRSIDCHYKDDKSLHTDLIRLMRRGGVISVDEGALLEAYTSLRNYISLCLQNLEEIVEDGNVEVQHIEQVTNMLAIHNDSKKFHIKLQTPYYYNVDFNEYVEPAKSFDDVEVEYLLDTEVQLYDETIGADTRECLEGLRKDIHSALRDEQLRVLCDSFVQCEDGSKVGVYTPILKHRLPLLYSQFFDSEEKRKNGLNISSVHFQVQEYEYLVFDENVVTEWLTCIYLGEFEEKKTNNLTLQKLLAKWLSPEIEPQTDMEVTESDSDLDSEDSSEEEYDEDLELESDSEEETEEYDEETQVKRNLVDHPEEEESNVEPLTDLYLDEESKDFSLTVNSHTIKVHKYLLGMRSSYFKVLFSGNFSDTNISEYDVSEFLHNLQTVELFTFFLYHDTLENDDFTEEYYVYQNLIDLEEFSQFILCEKLKLECHSALVRHLNFENTLKLLKESLESNNEEFFHIAHAFLLKSPHSYFENILDETLTKYYRMMCTSKTLENAFLKLDYLNSIEQEATLHPFILGDVKIQIENLHWFIANRASSLESNFITTLPQPIQDLISRYCTHDNLGMADLAVISTDPVGELSDSEIIQDE